MDEIELLGRVQDDWAAPDGTQWFIETQWALIEGRAECVGFEMRSVEPIGRSRRRARRLGRGRVGVLDTKTFRKVNLGDFTKRARARVASALRKGHVVVMPQAERVRNVAAFENVAPKAGRPPIPDSELMKVAKIYTAADNAGEPPVLKVAEKMNLSYDQAETRVRRARERGFLPPTEQGRSKPAATKKRSNK